MSTRNRVLVVDDDQFIRELWNIHCRTADCEIVVDFYHDPDHLIRDLYDPSKSWEDVRWVVFDYLFRQSTIADWLDALTPLLKEKMPMAWRYLCSYGGKVADPALDQVFHRQIPKNVYTADELDAFITGSTVPVDP